MTSQFESYLVLRDKNEPSVVIEYSATFLYNIKFTLQDRFLPLQLHLTLWHKAIKNFCARRETER